MDLCPLLEGLGQNRCNKYMYMLWGAVSKTCMSNHLFYLRSVKMGKSKSTVNLGLRPRRNTTTHTHRGIKICSQTSACGNDKSIPDLKPIMIGIL